MSAIAFLLWNEMRVYSDNNPSAARLVGLKERWTMHQPTGEKHYSTFNCRHNDTRSRTTKRILQRIKEKCSAIAPREFFWNSNVVDRR
jgi:hypothetical protein